MSLDKNLSAADKALAKMEKKTVKAIKAQYQQALRTIRTELAEVDAKYGLEYSALQKYNRLNNLEKDIQTELSRMSGNNSKILASGLKEQYKESYYNTAFAIEAEAQIRLGYRTLNPRVVEKAVENELSKLALQRNRTNVVINVKQALTQGLIQGKGYRDVARKVKDALESNANNALRIVATETHRVQMEARNDSMEHAVDRGVVMKKRWVATLDDRTRDSHQDLDGQEVDMDERFSNGLMYPGELGGPAEEVINCRCTYTGVIAGYEPEARRARDEGIIPYTNYKDWFANRIS